MSLTSEITNTITDPTNTPIEGVVVIARLRPVAAGIRVDDQTEISGEVRATSDSNGDWSLSLERNGNITPANTYWEIEERVPRTKGGTRTHAIVVGAADSTLAASGIATTTEANESLFLTLEAADARYLRNDEISVVGAQTTFLEDVFFKSGRPQHDAAAFGAVEDGVTDDRIFIQSAINFAAAFGGGDVVVRNSKISSNHPTFTATLPRDDGTIPAGAPIAAEPVVPYPVQLVLKPYVSLRGTSGKAPGTLIGTWDLATVNIAQPVMIYLGETQYLDDASVQNLTIQNAFIGVGAFTERIVVECNFNNLHFYRNAIPILTDKLERTHFKNIRLTECYAGLVNGGMWGQRYNGPGEFSWADKSSVDYIHQVSTPYNNGNAGALDIADDIDEFYDTYFFKTANTATRGGVGAPDYFAALPYRGITGPVVSWLNRYGRPSVTSHISHIFAHSGRRCGVKVDQPLGVLVEFIHIERFGWINQSTETGVFGVDRVDPYRASKSVAFVDIAGVQPVNAELKHIVPISANAIRYINTPDNAAISYSQIKTLTGAGAVDEGSLVIDQFYGKLRPIGDVEPYTTNLYKLGLKNKIFSEVHAGSLGLGANSNTRDDTDRDLLLTVHTGIHAPGSAWTAKTWLGSELTPVLGPLLSGTYIMLFHVTRGDDRKLVGARLVNFSKHGAVSTTGKSVTTLGVDANDVLNTQTMAVTVDDEGVVSFDYVTNFNSSQTAWINVSLIRLAGQF